MDLNLILSNKINQSNFQFDLDKTTKGYYIPVLTKENNLGLKRLC